MSELFCWLRTCVAMLNSYFRLKWASSLPCCLHHELRKRGAIEGPRDQQHLLVNKSCPVLVVSASTTTSASPSSIEFGSRGSPSTSARATSASPSSIEFGSRGSPSTSATATSASSSSTEFGSGGSPFYFGEHDFNFALADGVRLEALTVGLRQATISAFARVGRARPEGLTSDFRDGDYDPPFFFGDDEE